MTEIFSLVLGPRQLVQWVFGLGFSAFLLEFV